MTFFMDYFQQKLIKTIFFAGWQFLSLQSAGWKTSFGVDCWNLNYYYVLVNIQWACLESEAQDPDIVFQTPRTTDNNWWYAWSATLVLVLSFNFSQFTWLGKFGKFSPARLGLTGVFSNEPQFDLGLGWNLEIDLPRKTNLKWGFKLKSELIK